MSRAHLHGPGGPFTPAVGWAAVTIAALVTLAELVRAWGTPAVTALGFVFLLAMTFALIVTAVAAALIGLPLTWLLKRKGLEAPWSYPAAGLVAGAALMVGFDPFGSGYNWLPMDGTAVAATLGGVPGFVCGYSWWHYYRRYFQAGRRG